MVVTTKAVGGGLSCVLGGIALVSAFPTASFLIPTLLGSAVVLCVIGVFRQDRVFLLSSLSILLVILGMVRVTLVDPVRIPEADASIGLKVHVRGVVMGDPDRRAGGAQYVVRMDQIDMTDLSSEPLVRVSLPRHPEYSVGDVLELSGALLVPEDFEIDAVRPPFPYVTYLAKDGIGYVMRSPRVENVEGTDEFPIRRTLSSWKHGILERGNVIFPEPEGGLLAGMILGERHALPADILEEMRTAGLVHIIVVSGYNMTVVAEGISRVFRALPLFSRASIGLVVIWIYAGMVAGGAPVVRAAIMTSLALIARMTGNSAIALRLLYLSAIVMILHNPRIVLHDASFHLSFLATLGLIILSPKIVEKISRRDHEKHVPWWKELFAASVAAQAMVIPYILFFSGQLSPYALPANLLALPFVPIAMALGTLALVLGTIIPWVGPVLGMVASIPAWWVTLVGHFFAGLPGSDTVFPIPLSVALALYLLGWFAVRGWWKSDRVDVPKE